MYRVLLKNRVLKSAKKMPKMEQLRLTALLDDLRSSGPVQASWKSYSGLGGERHHCHLSYHWVACWEETEKGIEIEVYYAGSRESAPY